MIRDLSPTLLGLLLVCCSPSSQAPKAPAPAPSNAPATTHNEEKASQPVRESAPAPLVVYSADGALAVLDPATGARRELNVKTDVYFSGGIDTGGTRPLLSPDGRWLAVAKEGKLSVVSLADGGVTPLNTLGNDYALEASISAWNPDSSGLLYHFGDSTSEDDDIKDLPDGFELGFYFLKAGEAKGRRIGHIKAFSAWSGPNTVVHNTMRGANDYALLAYSLAPGEPRVLATIADGYGFSQLHIHNGEVVYTSEGQAHRGKLGEEAKPITPDMGFANLQWPKLSPTNTRVAIVREGNIALVKDAATPPEVVAECGALCTYRWYGDDAIVTTWREKGVIFIDLKTSKTRELTPDGGLVEIGGG